MAIPDREKLIRLTERDINLYASDQRAELTAVGKLGKRAQFSVTGAQHVITNEGLAIKRKQAQEEKRHTPLPQTEQTAWLLGHLVSPRHTNPTQLLVTSTAPETASKVSTTIHDIFKLKPSSVAETQTKHGVSTLKRYSSRDVVARLGNLTPDEFGTRALRDYPWLFNDENMTWHFLEGLFDERGNIVNRSLVVFTTSQVFGDFIKGVLSNAGAQDLKEVRNNTGLTRIYTRDHDSLKLFAANIHSSDPAKEQKLDELRKHEFKVKSPYEILDIWKAISQNLGRPAQLSDIEANYREKKIPWSPSLFKRFFGGSYSEANHQLKKLSMVTADYFLKDFPLPSNEALAQIVVILKSVDSLNPEEIKPVGYAVTGFLESIKELKERTQVPLPKTLTQHEQDVLTDLLSLVLTSEIFTGLSPKELTQRYSETSHRIRMELSYLKRKMAMEN